MAGYCFEVEAMIDRAKEYSALIAAAPDLYEACKLITESWKHDSSISYAEIVEAAQAALNKANGKKVKK